jgi:hypothetical protein
MELCHLSIKFKRPAVRFDRMREKGKERFVRELQKTFRIQSTEKKAVHVDLSETERARRKIRKRTPNPKSIGFGSRSQFFPSLTFPLPSLHLLGTQTKISPTPKYPLCLVTLGQIQNWLLRCKSTL